VAVLGILSRCQSLRDLERFAIRHYSVLTETLGLQLRRPPSVSAFRYFFQQVDVGALCAAMRGWTIAQIPGGATDLDQLMYNGKTLRGSIEPTPGDGSTYITQVELCSAALGVAISQAFYATGEDHERAVPPASRRAGSGGRADPGGCPPYAATVFRQLQEQGADFLLTVKVNQKALHRQIRSQFQGKRHIPFVASDHEIGHGRDITWTLRAKQAPEHIRETRSGTSWIVEVSATCTRDGKPFQATHLLLTSLRTTPEALLQLVRDRWSIEGWRWIRDTQLHEHAHRYRGNGAGAMATLRMAALNLLRLAGCQSIRAGMQAVMHDITALLAMARTQPELAPN
jgi:predicted transposase YbfD/YdcC